MQKLKDCEGCPLAGVGTRMVQGVQHPGAVLKLVGSFPTQQELRDGQAFSGQSGKEMVEKYLALAQVGEEDCDYDYALRCAPPLVKGKPAMGPSVLDKALECCAQYDTTSGAKLLVALGPIATRKFYQGELKPHELRGHLLPRGE